MAVLFLPDAGLAFRLVCALARVETEDFLRTGAAGCDGTVRRAREEPAGFFLGDDFFGFIALLAIVPWQLRDEVMAALNMAQWQFANAALGPNLLAESSVSPLNRFMKKILLRVGIGVVILIVAAVLIVSLFLDSAVKRGVEVVGPKLTKVDVKLGSASISLLSGSGKLSVLELGNPEGYKTPHSITLGKVSLALRPGTILSDKLVIKSLNLEAPEITFEGGLTGNNLSKIVSNIEGTTSGNSEATQSKEASKKLQVDELVITGGKVHVTLTDLGGQSGTVPLPDISLKDLGTGPDGITVADLSKKILQEILVKTTETVTKNIGNLGKNATDLTKNLGQNLGTNATDEAKKIGKSVGDLFKKK